MRKIVSGATLLLVGFIVGLALVPSSAADRHAREVWRKMQQATVVLIFPIAKGSWYGHEDETEYVRCSGVLVRDVEVQTASHCFTPDWKPENVIVEGWMGDRARGVRLTSNSPERDLALLHLDHPIKSSVPAIVSDDYAPGDDIAIVGSPDGVKFKTSYGRLSDVWVDSRMRNCDPADAVGTRNQDYLVLDASTWSGNSGGGAFDNEGRVIGIVVRVHTTSIGECKRPDDKNREYREVLLDMGGPLWGYAVAGKEVKTFLREAGL